MNDNQPKTVTVPKNVGFYVEYCGNITGAFHRAETELTGTFERYHGASVIFRVQHPKLGNIRCMTRTDLVQVQI